MCGGAVVAMSHPRPLSRVRSGSTHLARYRRARLCLGQCLYGCVADSRANSQIPLKNTEFWRFASGRNRALRRSRAIAGVPAPRHGCRRSRCRLDGRFCRALSFQSRAPALRCGTRLVAYSSNPENICAQGCAGTLNPEKKHRTLATALVSRARRACELRPAPIHVDWTGAGTGPALAGGITSKN